MADTDLTAFSVPTKRCTKCSLTKPLSEFYVSRRQGGVQRQCRCKPCQRAANAANHAKRIRTPEEIRRAKLRQLYGMTEADYDRLLARQGGGCAVCRSRPGGDTRILSVDHNHTTGDIRGLLCTGCNAVLGRIERFPGRFAQYLRSPPAKSFGFMVRREQIKALRQRRGKQIERGYGAGRISRSSVH